MTPARSHHRSQSSRFRPSIERLWQRNLPASKWALWAALVPASMLYSGALALRARWWRRRASGIDVATISVGNLTVGGNGKTPFTLFLASRLRERGIATAIISRGWGRTSGAAAMVSDGTRILMSPREAGDEPVMMAKSFAGPIAVARRRIDAAALLSARGRFGAFVLDDGFQHLRLSRDLNLLLINTTRGFGNGWVLPAGPLREPRNGIARADAIVLIDSTNAPINAPVSAARSCATELTADRATAAVESGDLAAGSLDVSDLALPNDMPIVRASIRPRALVQTDAAGWHERPLALAGRRIVAVSGLADPASFHAMLRQLGATIVATLEFPDHHDYTPHDVENVLFAATGTVDIVTTEKDLVKLERFPQMNVSLYALRLEVSMEAGDEARLFDLIAARIGEKARASGVAPSRRAGSDM
jgi:tetraacyldisaccharide 4'-kinase